MQTRRRFHQLALAGLALPTAHMARAQERRAIVLGQSAPLTGPAAQLGLQMQLGAKICFDAVNAAGGIGGLPITLKTLDDGYGPGTLQGQHREIHPGRRVRAVRLCRHAHVAGGAAAGHRGQDPLHRTVHRRRGAARPVQQAGLPHPRFLLRRDRADREAAHSARPEEDRRLPPERRLRPGWPEGRDARAGEARPAAGGGGHGGAQQRGRVRGAEDAGAAQPEAIVQISAYKSCAAFIREARKAGYFGQFYNVSFVGTQALADELGKDAAGVVVSQVMPSPFGTAVGLVNDYQQALDARLDSKAEPNYTSIEGYVAARVLVDGPASPRRPPSRAKASCRYDGNACRATSRAATACSFSASQAHRFQLCRADDADRAKARSGADTALARLDRVAGPVKSIDLPNRTAGGAASSQSASPDSPATGDRASGLRLNLPIGPSRQPRSSFGESMTM